MKSKIHTLQAPYRLALLRHLRQGTAASLRPAQRLGRQAGALGADTLNMARIHEAALGAGSATLAPAGAAERNRLARRGGLFFAEAILPLEARLPAALEANQRLRALQHEMVRRNRELQAAKRKLTREIEGRRVAQESFERNKKQWGDLLAQSRQLQDQLRFLSRRVLSVQEAERKQISHELHDVIAEMLMGINIGLATLKADALTDARGLYRTIAQTQRLVTQSVDRVHRFARQLRPTVLDDLGLIPALHAFLKSFMQETGVQVKLTAQAEMELLNSAKRTVLYRVAQEALTNIARHAQATQAEVGVHQRARNVELQIHDDGQGFDVARLWHGRKLRPLGLLGMRERVEMVGGTFTIQSAPGQGTTLLVQIPFAIEERKYEQ